MEKRKVLLKDSTDEIFDLLVTEPERSEASEEQSEDELTAEQNQSDKVSFYEDYVEALMEFCEKRSNAPKSEEEKHATDQEQNHSEASDEHSEDEQVREYEEERTEDGKLIWLRDDYGSVYVYDIDKILDEIDSLKCLLDKQAITDTEFYFKCHKLINSYGLPF